MAKSYYHPTATTPASVFQPIRVDQVSPHIEYIPQYDHVSAPSASEAKLRNSPDSEVTELGPTDPESSPLALSRGWLFYGCIGTLCVVTFVIAVDAVIIGVTLPTIAASLQITAIEAFWAGTSFLLTSTVFQPLFASFSHIFGRQPALIAAVAFFTIGSVLAPLAKGAVVLLVGRTIQGVGAGGINALSQVILTDLVSLRERGKWDSLLSIAWAIGSVISPIIGGAFVQVDWRWIFWFNLPFCALAFILIPLMLRLNKTGAAQRRLREFDWVGCLLFTASLTVFLIPLSWGGVMYPWSSYQTLVPLLIGFAGMIAFGFHIAFASNYLGCDPFLRPSLFSSLTGLTAYGTTVIQWLMLWSACYYQPLFYEVAKGYSVIISGVAMLPYTFTIGPGAAITGIVIAKTGRYRVAVWVGWALTTLGVALLMRLDQDTSVVTLIFLPICAGAGFGILTSAQKFAGQAFASNDDLPFAAGLNMFFRSLGQVFGVAIGGVVFQNALSREISGHPEFSAFADDWARDASALVTVIGTLGPEQQKMKSVLIQSYVDSLQTLWVVMAVFGGFALVCSLLGIKEKTLERQHETDQGLARAGQKRIR